MSRRTAAPAISGVGSRGVHRRGLRARITKSVRGGEREGPAGAMGSACAEARAIDPAPLRAMMAFAETYLDLRAGPSARTSEKGRCEAKHAGMCRAARRAARGRRYTRSGPTRRVEIDCRKETSVETIASARLFYIFQWATQSKQIPGALIFERQSEHYHSIDGGPFDLAYVDPDQFALERAEAGLAEAPLVA